MLFPLHNCVVLEREQDQHDWRQPEQPGGDGKPDPYEYVADIKRISHETERAARNQRPEPIGAGSRDCTDVLNGAQAQRFAGPRKDDAGTDEHPRKW